MPEQYRYTARSDLPTADELAAAVQAELLPALQSAVQHFMQRHIRWDWEQLTVTRE